MSPNGHWNSSGLKLDPEKAVGFVYIIVEKSTNRKYIGKKNFRGKGTINKGQQSNWKTYTSSSKYLQSLIQEKGTDEFLFFILDQYHTIGGLSFAETWTQVICETPAKNDEFMNRYIDKVSWKVTEPITPRHRRKLKAVLKNYKFKEN